MIKCYKYVNIGKPIEIKKFCNKIPTGWIRIDILQAKLNKDKMFKSKFTKRELQSLKKQVNK